MYIKLHVSTLKTCFKYRKPGVREMIGNLRSCNLDLTSKCIGL